MKIHCLYPDDGSEISSTIGSVVFVVEHYSGRYVNINKCEVTYNNNDYTRIMKFYKE
jgi:hypothetical protein